MPPLLKLTLLIFSLHSKPHISLLLRRSSASLLPPASSPRRNFKSLPISLCLSQPQSQSFHTHTYICKQRRQLRGEEDSGGLFLARFSRRVGGGGGGGSGREMGSETNNNHINHRDENQLFLNNNLSVSSGLIKQNNHNNKDRDRDDRCNELTESPSKQPRHQSTKLLTLPTILTIGRVAAVPILVCSKFRLFYNWIACFFL